MATTNKFTTTGTPVTLIGSGLDSMLAAATVVGSAVNNISAGTANLDGYYFGRFFLTLAAPLVALEEGVAIFYPLVSPDGGTDYEDGTTSLRPKRLPPVVFYIPATDTSTSRKIAGAQRISDRLEKTLCDLEPSYWKPQLYLNCPSGQLAASGNTLEVLAVTNNV